MNRKARCICALWLAAMAMISQVWAGMAVARLEAPPAADKVLIAVTNYDAGGNTSIRHTPRENRDLKYDRVLKRYYFNRDRDLGQTFRTGPQPIRVDALTLRTGFGTMPFRDGAAGAEMFVQWLEVEGNPSTNDHGTTTAPPGTHWQTFNPNLPHTDDYLEGESFKSLRVIRGGFMPDLRPYKANLQGAPGNGQFFRFSFTDEDRVILQPHRTYAFLVGFVSPAPERAMALANAFQGRYAGGHGIRREGSADTPAFFNPAESTPYTRALLVADTNDAVAMAAALEKACFPVDFAERVADMTFGTMGMPDVCTYRDLVFYLEGTILEKRPVP